MYLDIEKIKREVSMAQILDYYGIELKKKGKLGLYGSCPIHDGDNQNAFHVDLGKTFSTVLVIAVGRVSLTLS